ncbi:MAG TPA: c-type cytochrome, partial [Planctomycetia bacterium]|nr:c-type cytochrome [Planctomycetia bacterium]
FRHPRANCSGCHRAEGVGGRLGPELAKIGGSRGVPDLVEAIVQPSATIVRGFEPVQFELASGETFSGVVLKETAGELRVGMADRRERRLARRAIRRMKPATVSIMPAGYDKILTVGEIADLAAYLKSLK